jgi:hypothetical protein
MINMLKINHYFDDWNMSLSVMKPSLKTILFCKNIEKESIGNFFIFKLLHILAKNRIKYVLHGVA